MFIWPARLIDRSAGSSKPQSMTSYHQPRPVSQAFLAGVALALVAATPPASVAQVDSSLPPAQVTVKNTRAAADAYLAGAKQLSANDSEGAERNFTRAVALDPTKNEYALALTVAKQHHITALVQSASKERLLGKQEQADKLIAQAAALDPDNQVVAQHLNASPMPAVDNHLPVGSDEIARLGGAIRLKPKAVTHTVHRRGDAQDLLREIYEAFGIKATFDPSIISQSIRLDLDNADFATSTRILLMMSHVFAVPLREDSVLLAKDTREDRDRLVPLIEETVYLPGLPVEQLTELSNVAKNIFDLKQVNVAQGGGAIVLRGSDDALQLINATYADMLDGGADVMIEVHFYEVDKTHMRQIGAQLPTSIGAFAVPALAQNLVNANQSIIQAGVAGGLDITTGSYYQILARELLFLYAAGVNIPQLSSLIGTIGNIGSVAGVGALPLAGIFLGSGTTFNFLLNNTDVRSLDDVQLRMSDRQMGTFRSGTRYPVTTATYSSGVSSSLASSLAGVKINGQSVSSLLSSLSTATVPQVQYEDLGLTLKATPQVLKSGQVFVHLDMKIEALGGGMINSIPILNSRQLTSDITIPDGQTAMLTSEVSTQEQRAIVGIPLLNEIPGLQGTERNVEIDNSELLITLTPHVIRKRSPVIATRRLSANLGPEAP